MSLIKATRALVAGMDQGQQRILSGFLEPVPEGECVQSTVALQRKYEDALSQVSNAIESFRQRQQIDFRLLRLLFLSALGKEQEISVKGEFLLSGSVPTSSEPLVRIVEYRNNGEVSLQGMMLHRGFVVVSPKKRGIEQEMFRHFPQDSFATQTDISAIAGMIERSDRLLPKRIRGGDVLILYARGANQGEVVVLFSLLDTTDQSRVRYVLPRGQSSSWTRDALILIPY